jgi:uncharacterized protein
VSGVPLLDMNVLIALFDASHVTHARAHDWFATNRHRSWATCALTENGVIRIVSHPRYGSNAERPTGIAERLRNLCNSADHVWWPCSVSFRDDALFDLSAATNRQLTDLYLLGLAHTNGGVLATFDRSIPVNAVIGATRDTLEVIGA